MPVTTCSGCHKQFDEPLGLTDADRLCSACCARIARGLLSSARTLYAVRTAARELPATPRPVPVRYGASDPPASNAIAPRTGPEYVK